MLNNWTVQCTEKNKRFVLTLFTSYKPVWNRKPQSAIMKYVSCLVHRPVLLPSKGINDEGWFQTMQVLAGISATARNYKHVALLYLQRYALFQRVLIHLIFTPCSIPTPSLHNHTSLDRNTKGVWAGSVPAFPPWLWSQIMKLLLGFKDFPFILLLCFLVSWLYLFERNCRVQFLF